jgi:D-alanyl-lipoteichoic acid acyltransferase DltB (MBOAT superfamily)
VSSLLAALQAVVRESEVLLRILFVAACWTGLLALWTKRVPMYVAAALGILGSALVLRGAFPAFLLVNLLAFGVVHGLQASRRRWPTTVVALVALVALFLVGRHRGWDTALLRDGPINVAWFYFDMWMFLRLFVLFWEVGSERQQAPAFASFIAWCTSPLFLAGPLLRSSRWPDELKPRRAALVDRRWWLRIGTGLAMVSGGIVLGALTRLTHGGGLERSMATKAVTLFFLAPWGFYWSIAGAFLFLAALGELHGIVVGPSFDRPFFQANIADFWARWNITATTVFREFFFYNRWGLQSFNPYVNILVVFLAVGLWHGSNVYWIGFGLIHGIYFSTYLWLRSRFPGGRAAVPKPVGVAFTYVAVCLAWYIPSKVAVLFQR